MKVEFKIRVEDCGGYYQVYKEYPEYGEVKMGNILPPGYAHFKEQEPSICWVAEHDVYGNVQWQNMERALAYLISPRGMT